MTEVKSFYVHDYVASGAMSASEAAQRFDRILDRHDREVAARALRELHGELAAWEGYDTRDIGWAFLADSVLEHIDEKRAELEKGDVDV